MDFLNKITKQLAQMEEQARLLQAMEASGVTLDPKQAKQQKRSQGKDKGKRGHGQQPPRPQRSLVSHDEVFETPHCATEGGLGSVGAVTKDSPQSRLVDTLYGRCDEAFLLSEILGPPRCMKGWAE